MKGHLGMLAAISLIVTGCESIRPISHDCDGQTPGPPITIHFDDSKLFVTPPSKPVKKGKFVRVNTINPSSMDSYDVTISSNTSWLNASGEKSNGTIPMEICVPEDEDTGSFKYQVEVANIGQLDPRVEVIP